MPNSFANDGAAGAGGGVPISGAAGTLPSSGGTITDQQALAEFGSGALGNGVLAPNGYGGVWSGNNISDAQAAKEFGPEALMFDGGGTVPDQDDASAGSSQDQSGDPSSGTGDPISLALSTVDQALDYGRKLNGLPSGGGDQVASSAYDNGRMPAIPGNQSNSGTKPIQPMPGPLPPTSNPFGKRQQVGANEPDDGGQTTIPTDDDDDSTETS